MKLSKYIACICEGAAEQAIIERLLDKILGSNWADKQNSAYLLFVKSEILQCLNDFKGMERQQMSNIGEIFCRKYCKKAKIVI